MIDHISKHLEIRQKLVLLAARRIFNALLGVWRCGQTRSLVFDILQQPVVTSIDEFNILKAERAMIKHLEVRQKFSAACRIFNSLFGVWKCGQTLSFVFDILQQPVVTSIDEFNIPKAERAMIKHLEVRQKFSAARRIFNSLLDVWKCGRTRSLIVFDLFQQPIIPSIVSLISSQRKREWFSN